MKPTQRNEKPAHNMRLPRAKPVFGLFFRTTYSASSWSFTQTFLISLLNSVAAQHKQHYQAALPGFLRNSLVQRTYRRMPLALLIRYSVRKTSIFGVINKKHDSNQLPFIAVTALGICHEGVALTNDLGVPFLISQNGAMKKTAKRGLQFGEKRACKLHVISENDRTQEM